MQWMGWIKILATQYVSIISFYVFPLKPIYWLVASMVGEVQELVLLALHVPNRLLYENEPELHWETLDYITSNEVYNALKYRE